MELLAAVLGPDTSTRTKRLHFAGVALIGFGVKLALGNR